uniref:PD-(D/E)XK nuclease family protein n=1 Tax=Rhizobium fredii TaxID=380 RepID=UPI0005608937
MDTREKITPLLESLLIHASEFRRLEDGLDVFCPFEALGMVGAEIRHSNYLAYILNPHRPHGFGAGLLRPFLIQALAIRPSLYSITPLDVHLLDLGSAEIRREWQNIDLLIVVPQERVVVAIELKIDGIHPSRAAGFWAPRV